MVLCEVHLLWIVCISDQMWLPKSSPGQFPHKELQLPQPLSLPGVSAFHSQLQAITDYLNVCWKVVVSFLLKKTYN